ncbi:MAG: phage Gp37/Gp68 family protein [Beijerinckiaceae bacterium]
MTKIEWTHIPGYKGETWNPVVGCSIVSPACTHCYAMSQAARIQRMSGDKPTHYAGTTKEVNGNHVWTGKIASAPEHIWTAPLRASKPRAYFVNSMGDLFHEDVPNEWIDRAFAIMALCPQHIFIVLTKRAERMQNWVGDVSAPDAVYDSVCDMALSIDGVILRDHRLPEPPEHLLKRRQVWLGRWPLPNVWLGVTAEDQARADERIPDLLATPAAVRLVSVEPMIGPILMEDWLYTHSQQAWDDKPTRDETVDWVIVGGESGPDARPMHPDWAQSLRDQCAAAGVAYFFKQWGEWSPAELSESEHVALMPDGRGRVIGEPAAHVGVHRWEPPLASIKVGKARAGHLLDGREHHEWPKVKP